MQVTVKEVLDGARSDGILGISDRAVILDYLKRAIELAAFKANYDVFTDTLDICSDDCGIVTLPSFVGTVLQVNEGGHPTIFRDRWFQFHVNGPGSQKCGPMIGFSDDMGWSPVYQDIKEWCVVTAMCEDPIDGNGSLSMIVEGETMDANGNPKDAITIPATGPSSRGVQIPLLYGVANTDPAMTYFRNFRQITKPVTRGYVKLIAFPIRQMATATNIGYYAPYETNPRYRRIRVSHPCKWVRVHYRRATIAMVNDSDIVPIGSYQATLELLKSIRLADSNNIDASEAYLARAVRLLSEIQSVESGNNYSPIQVEPGFGIGYFDPR
jgi:hypothetical protein